EYLSTMSDGNISAVWSTMDTTKKGEIRDKFNIAVEKAGFSKDFRGLSGGEKRKVRLACALALQDMVANRASKSIQLFIGDEIDDALDSAGLERLMGILEAKARERGTVMIVSHKEMKSWFRETVTLEIKEGRSYVV
ncbi:TPA: exonuclease, partial [Klebsiella pneumoniae]|nr:exonuclease [Klebsiella pneumoniae]